ncbi:MAG: RNA methyltransferase [Lachnospiraceae bacterium]|nr:RNA methyltransferase [Lachnospiraceae bacterium]
MIVSKSNKQLKDIKKLMDSSKARKEQKLFVVEGLRMTREVPEHLLEKIYYSESFFASSLSVATCEKKGEEGKDYEIVSDEIFKGLSDTVTPQGILGIVKQPEYQLKDAFGGKILILDDIQDPGNLGTMIRTSEAVGVTGVIMSTGCAVIFNPKVIRSTMESIFRVPFLKADLRKAIDALQKEGYTVYGAALDGAVFYNEITYGEKNAVVIGNEGNGISEKVLDAVDYKIKIPMAGKVESLNAAISAAVILYQL